MVYQSFDRCSTRRPFIGRWPRPWDRGGPLLSPPEQATRSSLLGLACGVRVLVVEDNAVNRRVAELMLEKLGATYRTATTAEDALELIAEESYDLVLLDCQLPGMDGLECARRVRQRELALGLNRVPIVALTASAVTEMRVACEGAGMDDFLAKPLGMAALGQILARWAPPPLSGRATQLERRGA